MRYSGKFGKLSWHARNDFRAKATFGVASAALLLLLPIAFLNFYDGQIAIGIGSLGIVFILGANAWMVTQGRCHQNLTLFGLVPAGMVFMISVFINDGIVGSLWCYPSIVACYCMLSERKSWLANLTILSVCLPMIWITLEPAYASRISATMIAVSVFSAILVSVIDEQRRQLQAQLRVDPLTGLLNRFSLSDELQKSVDAHTIHNTQSSLLAIDIDLFKQINDDHGHDCGDLVLARLGNVLKDALRQDDLCFRVGGEEFLLLLNGLPQDLATGVAERLRQQVETASLNPQGPVTISIGVAAHIRTESARAWSKRCDERLYMAKRQGRNRVVSFGPARSGSVTPLETSNSVG